MAILALSSEAATPVATAAARAGMEGRPAGCLCRRVRQGRGGRGVGEGEEGRGGEEGGRVRGGSGRADWVGKSLASGREDEVVPQQPRPAFIAALVE